MTARSTRNKLKWQCVMIMKDLDKCQGHLKLLSDLGGNNSDYIAKHIDNFVTWIELMRQTIKTFREGL
jgi:hypothetical protein